MSFGRFERPTDSALPVTAPTVSAARVAVGRIRLTFLEGPGQGGTHLAAAPRIRIGAHPGCDLVLAERTVSRWHCVLEMRGDHTIVTDLGSANGTVLNGVRVLRAQVEPGAVLNLGKARLGFALEDQPLELPLSAERSLGRMVGGSTHGRILLAALDAAAASDEAVLVHGEPGTGKHLAAELLHQRSARPGPMVVVDGAASPAQVVEAFTTAVDGTVVLDDVSALGRAAQAQLLRLLDVAVPPRGGRVVPRAGQPRPVALTTRELSLEAGVGRFRADLLGCLAQRELWIPPLRARPDDLPELVRALAVELGADDAQLAACCHPAALAELGRQLWHGNVRELRDHLERRLGAALR